MGSRPQWRFWFRALGALAGCMALAAVGAAQAAPSAAPHFAVISIRPSDMAAGGRGAPPNAASTLINGGILPHGGYRFNRLSVYNLFVTAYRDDLIVPGAPSPQIVGLPGWAQWNGTFFDIEAKSDDRYPDLPAAENTARVRLMLQSLLADRFHLVMHRDVRQVEGYRLEVAPGGPKNLAAVTPNADGLVVNPDFGAGTRLPNAPAGSVRAGWLGSPGTTMAGLCVILSQDRVGGPDTPIVDATGIEGMYAFHIDLNTVASDAPGPMGVDASDLQEGLKKYGLRLVKATIGLPILTIQSISPPTAN